MKSVDPAEALSSRPLPWLQPAVVPAGTTALVSATGLRKQFNGGEPILRGIDLRVDPGESVALIGANGCGKSTLLRCCLRLTEPDGGHVALLGADLTRMKGAALRRLRGRVGVVWQRHNLVPRLSALSNVLHGIQNRSAGPRTWLQGLARGEVRDEAMHCLEQVRLAHLAGRRADQLSGGESQRVAIARALMQRPDLVMADEPVASLDPKVGEEVMELFVTLLREQQVALLFVSHDLGHALRYARRVVGLRAGRVAQDASAVDLDHATLRTLYV